MHGTKFKIINLNMPEAEKIIVGAIPRDCPLLYRVWNLELEIFN